MTALSHATHIPAEMFLDAMSRLVSGLAVVTTSGANGESCGLLVSSICSYSAEPPSVLIAIDHATRSHAPLLRSAAFGVHLLGEPDDTTARTFATRGANKFAAVAWHWDGAIPRLHNVPVYLNCAVSATFCHGDHTVLIGTVTNSDIREIEPLVYYRRTFPWRLNR